MGRWCRRQALPLAVAVVAASVGCSDDPEAPGGAGGGAGSSGKAGSAGKAGSGGRGGGAGGDSARGGRSDGPHGGTAGAGRGGSSGNGAAGSDAQGGAAGDGEAGESSSGRAGAGGSAGATPGGGASGGSSIGGEGGTAEGGAGGEGPTPSVEPPSCSGMAGNECQGSSCCESPTVPGGTFGQGEPDAFRSTVRTFRLDRFEVTVGRMRRFIAGYDTWRGAGNPSAGAGAHPGVAGSGWDSNWDSLLYPTAAEAAGFWGLGCGSLGTYPQGTDGDSHPVNCSSFYLSFAFCIWDGGRLPTESELEYAAVGGSEDRVYSWGDTPVPDGVDFSRAVYQCMGDGVAGCTVADLSPVGSKPLGEGRFGQRDLTGSLFEWALDVYAALPTMDRSDYANVAASGERILKSGDWDSQAWPGANRTMNAADENHQNIGFRCARQP